MVRSNKTRFPGLLRRDMLRKRKPGRVKVLPLFIKAPVKITSDGTMYEERPDGRRRVGTKA